jgi:hypothetical protein
MRSLIGLIGILLLSACVTEGPPTFVEYGTREEIIGFFGDSSIIVHQHKWKVFRLRSGDSKVEIENSVIRNFNYRSGKYSDLLDYRGYASVFKRGDGLYLTPASANVLPYRRFDLVTHELTETNLRTQWYYMSENEAMLYECNFGIEQITALPDGRSLLSNASGAGGYCACNTCKFNMGSKWYLYNHYAAGLMQYRVIDADGSTSLATTGAILSGSYYVHSMGHVPFSIDSAGDLKVPTEFDPTGKLTETFSRLKWSGKIYLKEIEVDQGLFIEQDSLRSAATLEVVHLPHDFPL